MPSRAIRLVVLLAGVLLASVARADPPADAMPTDQVRLYEAVSNHTPELFGDLRLSRTSAHFSKLSGDMQLRHAGYRKGTTANEFDFTGDVYEVVNAEAFFAPNKGRNGFCPQPVRWLTIRDLSTVGSLGQPHSIRVGMLSIADWRDYDPAKLGACSADTFQLKSP